jgi:hypothetical protein
VAPLRALQLGVVALAIGGVGIARAQANDRAVFVDADATCGDHSSFAKKFFARMPGWRAATGDERAPKLVVTIAREANVLRGSLVVRDRDGGESHRELEGASCETVTDALVLMGAMAIDGEQSAKSSTDASASNANRSPVQEANAAASASSAIPASRSAPSRSRSASDLSDDRPSDHTWFEDRDRTWRAAFAASFGAEGGLAPSAAPSLAAFIEIEHASAAWSPSARIGFSHADSGDQSVANFGARFIANLATLDLCPQRWLANPIRVTACVRGEVGAFDASGLGIVPARSESRVWFAASAFASARYRIASLLFLEIDGGARVPLVRDQFYFEPNLSVFRTPAVSPFACLSLGVTIL